MRGMINRPYVAYYRVSTLQQERSGLGLKAQREAVRRFMQTMPGKLSHEITEVESGTKNNRPKLAEALRLCRVRSAVLVIARLDRLSRNVALISMLMDTGAEFVAADFPYANRLTIHVLAAVAEYEAKLISERIKARIAAQKARGVKFGGKLDEFGHIYLRAARAASDVARIKRAKARAMDLAPLVRELRDNGKSLYAIAGELTRLDIARPRGGTKWSSESVRRIFALSRLKPSRKYCSRSRAIEVAPPRCVATAVVESEFVCS
jgi:predicted site-specific integrase-resolvase